MQSAFLWNVYKIVIWQSNISILQSHLFGLEIELYNKTGGRSEINIL